MDLSHQAEGRIEMLKQRALRCVCKHCGEQLRIKRIIFSEFEDARVEIFCENCDRIEFGVEKEIFSNAKFFVEELGFTCFPDRDANEVTKKMTIAKVCEIMSWCNKNLGILNEHGFQVPINHLLGTTGETILLNNNDLEQINLVKQAHETNPDEG